jgi:hypothetical protein
MSHYCCKRCGLRYDDCNCAPKEAPDKTPAGPKRTERGSIFSGSWPADTITPVAFVFRNGLTAPTALGLDGRWPNLPHGTKLYIAPVPLPPLVEVLNVLRALVESVPHGQSHDALFARAHAVLAVVAHKDKK